MQSRSHRVPAEERRRRILEAVVPVFAEKGFHGATTRELAEAAGVSEALLYRHFPGKDSMYEAIFEAKLADPGIAGFLSMPPSTAKLVACLQGLFCDITGDEVPPGAEGTESDGKVLARLVLRSLLDDGVFTRTVLDTFRQQFLPLFVESFEAAREAGDLIDDLDPDLASLGVWFTHHLAVTLKLFALPEIPVAEHERPREQVLDQALRFALRGIGIREEVVTRVLAQLAESSPCPMRPIDARPDAALPSDDAGNKLRASPDHQPERKT